MNPSLCNSFALPGFRVTYDWFPSHIYYTAPAARVKEYRDKFRNKEDIPTVEKMSSQVSKVLDQLQRIQDNLRQPSPTTHLGNQQLDHRPDDGYDSEASDLDTQLLLGRKSRIRTDRRAAIAQAAELIPRSEELTNVQAAATAPKGDSHAPKTHMQEQEPGTSRAAENADERGSTLQTEKTMPGLTASESSRLAAHRRVDGDQMLLQLMLEIRQLKDQVSGLTASTQRQSTLMLEVFKASISHITGSTLPPVPAAEVTSSDNST